MPAGGVPGGSSSDWSDRIWLEPRRRGGMPYPACGGCGDDTEIGAGNDEGASDPGASDPGASDAGASDAGASDPGESDDGELERGGTEGICGVRTEAAPLFDGVRGRGGGSVVGGKGAIEVLEARRSSSESVGLPTTWSAAISTARAAAMSPG
jgi:hypothetical protein